MCQDITWEWPIWGSQSVLKEINPEYSLEGLMQKLKLQYFGHLKRRAYSLENALMLGKTEGKRRRGGRGWDDWMASLIQWTWVWANSGRHWRTGELGMLQSLWLQRVRHYWVTKQQQKIWGNKQCSEKQFFLSEGTQGIVDNGSELEEVTSELRTSFRLYFGLVSIRLNHT